MVKYYSNYWEVFFKIKLEGFFQYIKGEISGLMISSFLSMESKMDSENIRYFK